MKDHQARYLGKLGVIESELRNAQMAVSMDQAGNARPYLANIRTIAETLVAEINDEIPLEATCSTT